MHLPDLLRLLFIVAGAVMIVLAWRRAVSATPATAGAALRLAIGALGVAGLLLVAAGTVQASWLYPALVFMGAAAAGFKLAAPQPARGE